MARVIKYGGRINDMTYTDKYEQIHSIQAAYLGGSDGQSAVHLIPAFQVLVLDSFLLPRYRFSYYHLPALKKIKWPN
jgi:hypothetical protein